MVVEIDTVLFTAQITRPNSNMLAAFGTILSLISNFLCLVGQMSLLSPSRSSLALLPLANQVNFHALGEKIPPESQKVTKYRLNYVYHYNASYIRFLVNYIRKSIFDLYSIRFIYTI